MNWTLVQVASRLIIPALLVSFASVAQARLCVTKDKAFLRAGPGTKYKKTWTVGKYMPLKQVGKKGRWYRVQDLDKQTHWIHANLVTTKLNCVVVSAKYTLLRKGPGRKFPLADIRSVDRYTPFRKLGREDAWILLEDERGQQYWTYDRHIWEPLEYVSLSF